MSDEAVVVCADGWDAVRVRGTLYHANNSGSATEVCPHGQRSFASRIAYQKAQAEKLYGQAVAFAHQHLTAVEDCVARQVEATQGATVDLHLSMADGWSRLALAVKP